ncbi:ribonuclease H-like domain-containing protein [Tissierellaceae bacterium HCP3S3_D8]
MEIIKTKINRELPIGKHVFEKDICFLDIETTGLSRYRDIIYLVGILSYDSCEKSWVLSQLFIDNSEDEKELLVKTMDILSDFNMILNYNGDSFDIPFINYRLKLNGLDLQISKQRSIDIYSIIRKNRYLFELPNLKLKTIEKFLGIYREDMFSGKDCIGFYKDYVINNDLSLKERILKHNYDDLYYLMDIIKILDLIKDKKSFIFCHDKNDIIFNIDSIEKVNDYLFISGDIEGNILNKIMYYGENYKILIDNENSFEISIEVKKGLVTAEKTCLFIDRNSYEVDSNITWESDYNIPQNIILLEIDSKYNMDNIKRLMSFLLSKVFT